MASSAARATFDPAQFRQIIGHFMSGVTVVATHEAGRDHGMTASAVSSLSLEPPMLTVCLNLRSPTQAAISRTGHLGVSILSDGQDELAARFAAPSDDKFAGVAVHRGPRGQPLLDGALAAIECSVSESVVGGTHRVFLAEVSHASVGSGLPLAYYRGRFGRLELEADDAALARLRRAVVLRELELDERLEPSALGARFGLPSAAVAHSLTRLLSEGLVMRDREGFRQTPLDAARCDDAFDAKLVIDLGAARLALERATDDELAGLEPLARATAPGSGGGGTLRERIERHVAANEAFHERSIRLSGSRALLAAYRQLRLPAVLSRVALHDREGDRLLADDHLAIARAMSARDGRVVERLLAVHHERGKRLHRHAVAAAGGRL